jgi:hypothetical protein
MERLPQREILRVASDRGNNCEQDVARCCRACFFRKKGLMQNDVLMEDYGQKPPELSRKFQHTKFWMSIRAVRPKARFAVKDRGRCPRGFLRKRVAKFWIVPPGNMGY